MTFGRVVHRWWTTFEYLFDYINTARVTIQTVTILRLEAVDPIPHILTYKQIDGRSFVFGLWFPHFFR